MATEMLWVSLEGHSRTNSPRQRFHSQLFCRIVRYFCRTLYQIIKLCNVADFLLLVLFWIKAISTRQQFLQTLLYLSPDRTQTVLHSSPVASSANTAFSHPLRFMHKIGAVYRHTLDCTQRARDWSQWNAPWVRHYPVCTAATCL